MQYAADSATITNTSIVSSWQDTCGYISYSDQNLTLIGPTAKGHSTVAINDTCFAVSVNQLNIYININIVYRHPQLHK
jgi:hypothetical protein